jgi:hypothetical protein
MAYAALKADEKEVGDIEDGRQPNSGVNNSLLPGKDKDPMEEYAKRGLKGEHGKYIECFRDQ